MLAAMSGDETDKIPAPFDATLRALVSGRRVFGRYTLEVIAGRGGMGGNVWQRMKDGGLRGASFVGNAANKLASSGSDDYDGRSFDFGFNVVCVVGSAR